MKPGENDSRARRGSGEEVPSGPGGSTQGSRLSRLAGTAVLVTLLAVTLYAFWPCLSNEFTNWDDDIYVTRNELVREFSPGQVGRIFSSFHLGNYHPLTFLSYALDYRIFGLDPRGFHAVNLLLHLANCLLVFRFLFLLVGSGWAAAAGALFFSVHPMRVESVAWVSDRKDLLATFFFLSSLVSYLAYSEHSRARHYLLSLGAFAAALLSKATAVSLPLILLLLDFLRGRPFEWRKKVPYFTLALAAGTVALTARLSFQGVLREQGIPASSKAALGLHRLVHYYLLRILQAGDQSSLNPIHPVTGESLLTPLSIASSLIVLAALTLVAAWSLRRTRKVVFAALFFLLSLAPVLVVTNLGFSADRFAYLPSVAISYLLAALLAGLAGRRPGSLLPLAAAVLAVSLVTVGLAGLSRQRCSVWHDSRSLWTEAIRVFPGVAPYHNSLGTAHAQRGDYREANREFAAALAIDPSLEDAYLNRGAAFNRMGKHGEAVREYTLLLERNPGHAGAYIKRAASFAKAGQVDRAIEDYSRALRLNPLLAEAYYGRSVLYRRQGNAALADRDMEALSTLMGRRGR